MILLGIGGSFLISGGYALSRFLHFTHPLQTVKDKLSEEKNKY